MRNSERRAWWTEVGELMRSQVAQLSEETFHRLADSARNDPKWRPTLAESLGRAPLPQVMLQAVRRDQRGGCPAALFVGIQAREEGIAAHGPMSTAAEAIIALDEVAKREPALATVWMLEQYARDPSDRLAAVLLVAESPWQLPDAGDLVGEVPAEAVAVVEQAIAHGVEAVGAPQLFADLDDAEVQAWLGGTTRVDHARTNERASAESLPPEGQAEGAQEAQTESAASPPALAATDWAGADDAIAGLDALLDGAARAADRAGQALQGGAAPAADDVAWLTAARTAADALVELAGGPDEVDTRSLRDLLERVRGHDPGQWALDRLASVEGPAASELRAAAARAQEGAADPAPLVELVELVDAGEERRGAWMRLARRLPDGLEDACDALESGELVLPPHPTATTERDPETDHGDGADRGTPNVGTATESSDDAAGREPADLEDASGLGRTAEPDDGAVDDPVEPLDRPSPGDDGFLSQVPGNHPGAVDDRPEQPTGVAEGSAGLAVDGRPDVGEIDEALDDADAQPAWTAQADRLLAACLERTEQASAATHWVARAAGWDQRARAAAVLAWAQAVTSDESPTVARLHEATERLDDELADPIARPLLIAAALRAGVAAPYLSLNLVELVAGAVNERSALGQLLGTVRDAIYQGVRVDAASPRAHEPLAVAAGVAAEQARELLDTASRRKLGYQPATRVYHQWMDPEGDHGWLGRLLAIVADDARDRLAEVDQALQALERDPTAELVARMKETDSAARGDAPTIAHHARDALLRRAASHLEVVRDWGDAARRLRGSPPSTPQDTQRRLADLVARRETIVDELTDGASAPPATSAAELAARVVRGVLVDLEHGRAVTRRGSEQPDWLLALPLLVTRIEIDTTTLQPERTPTLDDLERLAADPDWETAFADRLAIQHLGEAAAIADVVAESDDSIAEQMRHEIAGAAEQLQQHLASRHADLAEQLATLRHEGLVDPEEAERLTVELDRNAPAGESAHDPAERGAPRRGSQADRGDVAGTLRRLERLAAEMEEARRHRIDDTRAWVRKRAASSPHVHGQLAQLEDLVDQGRLVLVEARVSELAAGNEPAELADNAAAPLTDTDSRILADAPPLDRDLIRAARNGHQWHDLDFAQRDKPDRELVANAVSDWLKLDASDTGAIPGHIRKVCRALGMEIERHGVKQDTDRSRSGVHWYNVAATVPNSAAAAVGSQAHHWQVVVTSADADPDKALTAVTAADRRPDEAIVHLHLGGLDLATRSDYTRKLRHRDDIATPVLLVDAGVMACRLARPRADAWRATCQLTLPFANVNPYRRDVGGEIAPEEFFGRRRHRDELIDPNGPVLLYGGRKLGKTALLNSVCEAAAHMEDTDAVLADLQQVGRSRPDAEAVWAEISAELARAGHERFAGLTDPDAVAAAVEAHLGEDATRRLLILLDEADAFLVADAGQHHAQINRLRQLMRRTERRCKFVLAGLHHVTRFEHGENQQLPNLGRAIGIGGMETHDAEQLVRRPLQALGWEIEATSVHQVLARTNFHPTLLQRFGYELTERLRDWHPDGPPPWRVTAQQVDDTLRDPGFVANVRDTVRLTADLDVRYAALAYALALAEEDRREVVALTVRELLDELRDLGVDEYLPTLNELETRHLLEEMQLLGLVRWDGHRVELRNGYLSRMLGSHDELLAALADLADRQTLESFADSQRRGVVECDDGPWPLPLTDQQAAAAGEPKQVTALVATPALAGGDSATTLRALEAPTHAAVVHGTKLGRTSAGAPPHARKELRRLVWADLRGHPASVVQRALERANDWARDPDIAGTTSVLALVDATRPAVLRQLHTGQLGNAVVVGPGRLDRDQAARFAADCDVEVGDPVALHTATNGWPWLLSAVVGAARASGRPADGVAAQAVADRLTATSHEELLDAFGLTALANENGMGAKLLDTLAALGSGGSADDVVRVALDKAPRSQQELARRELEVLMLLGVVARGREGDEVELDSIVAQHVWAPRRAGR